MEYELYHHGILGMHWGIRRYQNKDGSLTAAGRKRYGSKEALEVDKSLREYRRNTGKIPLTRAGNNRLESKLQSLRDNIAENVINSSPEMKELLAKNSDLARKLGEINSRIKKQSDAASVKELEKFGHDKLKFQPDDYADFTDEDYDWLRKEYHKSLLRSTTSYNKLFNERYNNITRLTNSLSEESVKKLLGKVGQERYNTLDASNYWNAKSSQAEYFVDMYVYNVSMKEINEALKSNFTTIIR